MTTQLLADSLAIAHERGYAHGMLVGGLIAVIVCATFFAAIVAIKGAPPDPDDTRTGDYAADPTRRHTREAGR